MKRYFCLFLAAFVLMGACSLCVIRPVSAAEDDPWYICELIPSTSITLELLTSGSTDSYQTWDLYDYLDRSAVSYLLSLPFGSSLDIVVSVNGASFACQLYHFLGDFDAHEFVVIPFWSSLDYPCESVDVPFLFVLTEDSADPDWSCLNFQLPVSYFNDISAANQTVTVSAYVGTLPPNDPIDPGAPAPNSGFYGSIESLIRNAFYGEGEITGWQDLVVTVLATAALVFMFVLPFLIVFLVIRLVVSFR